MGERRRGNYPEQARTYDLTRGASPSLLSLLARHLGPPAGRRLLDVGGGTGNYGRPLRDLGFDVVLVDVEHAMVRRSVDKIGPGRQVVGDAARLPIRPRAFDCAMMVAVLHLLPDPLAALRAARRVVRDGPLVVQAFTRENTRHLFVFDYFPGAAPPPELHPRAADVERWLRAAGFSRIDVEPFAYSDTVDANLHALHTDARLLADPAHLRNTSFFQSLPEEARREGLARLAADLESGALALRVEIGLREAGRAGHGTVFSARP